MRDGETQEEEARERAARTIQRVLDLHARHAAEVGRRELLGYLVDEFLHAEEDAFDILDNIHTVARADEMPGVMQQLRANSAVHHHTFETLDHLTAPWLAA